jgi:hypothetical protein
LEKLGILDWLSSCHLIGINTEGVVSVTETVYGLIPKTAEYVPHNFCSSCCASVKFKGIKFIKK